MFNQLFRRMNIDLSFTQTKSHDYLFFTLYCIRVAVPINQQEFHTFYLISISWPLPRLRFSRRFDHSIESKKAKESIQLSFALYCVNPHSISTAFFY